MPLEAGTLLGPYRVVAAIGSGGMGEVYRAVDTRLDRTVAIKVSADQFSERFSREARSVAALNHPNICQLYDVGPNHLVMEYVEGRPVGRVDAPRKLLDLAVQMADGMAAAHAAGIVHRDLKPDNILVTADGRVKILDFGIAKQAANAAGSDGLTRSVAMTDPGTTLGTVAYMSPEQARGEPNLGPQSDQFSFGLVLYEMATGQRAFRRDSTAETMTAIIREDAEPLPPSTPAPLRWVIERLLSKDPAERYESSRDLYRELRQIRERLSQATSAADIAAIQTVPPPRRSLVKGAGLALAGVAAGVVLTLGLRSAPSPDGTVPDLSRFRFTPISSEPVTEREPAWSPDGTRIAYVASLNGVLQVMTRTVGSTQAAQLTRGSWHAQRPFWSPDGSTIYFTSLADEGDRMWLWSVNATGGTPERVIEGATSAALHPDGRTFAFVRNGRLWIGEDPRSGDAPARQFGTLPSPPLPPLVQGFSPDGSRLAVSAGNSQWILAYPSGDGRHFPSTGSDASWMPDSRRLVVPAIDGATISLSMLDSDTGARRTFYASGYSVLDPAVSPDGRRIAFMGGDSIWNVVEIEVPSGRVRTMPSAGGVSWWPAWAPSGTHYAFVVDKVDRAAVLDMNSDSASAFSRVLVEGKAGGGTLNQLEWAPDGQRFTFTAMDADGAVLMIANATGGSPQRVDERAELSRNGVWSPDGQWLVYRRRVGADEQLVKTRPGSRSEPEVLKTWPATDANAGRTPVDWSPDGRWLLTLRSPTGIFLVAADGTTERQISARATTQRVPVGFTRDGRSVLHLEHNRSGEGAPWRLWSIDVASGTARILADVPLPATAGDVAGFSLHPDGTRFLTSVADWPFDIWMLEGFEP